MLNIHILKQLIQSHESSGSRSSVLNPISWLMVILLVALLICLGSNVASGIIKTFIVFISILFLLYVISYLYCLFTDKDALRSEKYSIQKLAIEKGLIGDNIQGIFETEREVKQLEETPATKKRQEDVS